MKKSLAIGLGITGGILAIGAIAGITLGLNAQFRDYVSNKVDNVLNDDALDLSKTKIESTIELTKAEKADQGVQQDANTNGDWFLQLTIQNLPSEVDASTVKLQTNIIKGDKKKAYFMHEVNEEAAIQYEGLTHLSGEAFALEHDLFRKDAEEYYTVRTYWIAHPSIYLDTKITFTYVEEEESSSAASSSAAPVDSTSASA